MGNLGAATVGLLLVADGSLVARGPWAALRRGPPTPVLDYTR